MKPASTPNRPWRLCCLGIVVVLTSCSGSASKTKSTTSSTSSSRATTTSIDRRGNERYVFTATQFMVSGSAPRVPHTLEARLRTMARTYLHAAMWTPLSTHVRDPSLAALFNADTAARIAPGKPDNAVVVDPIDGPAVTQFNATITLHVLTDAGGQAASAAATVVATASGKATVVRVGELLMLPIGNTWRIAGYDLTVTRDPHTGAQATTSTAKARP